MRIRKRQVPFPLLPVTLSDPNLINRSPVLVQLNDATTTSPKPSCTHSSATAPLSFFDPPQPSDQPLPPIGKPTDGPDDSFGEGGAHRRQHKKQECLVKDWREQGEGEGQKGNDTRKGGILCSEMPSEVFSSSSPLNSKQDGRWCEGEKSFPFKKRRGSFAIEDSNNKDNNDNGNKKKMKTKSRMKTKMNKKCLGQDDSNNEEEEEVVIREMKPDNVNVGKKRVRGGALMEGSRCSRVNGRGWRCCQQTLVGYSLCEHHLGKGRLRSMTSVRSRSVATSKNNMQQQPLSEPSSSSLPEKQTKCATHPLGNDGEDNNVDDEKKPVMVTKKRMKLGMVKARSISSLLGQTNTEISVAGSNNK